MAKRRVAMTLDHMAAREARAVGAGLDFVVESFQNDSGKVGLLNDNLLDNLRERKSSVSDTADEGHGGGDGPDQETASKGKHKEEPRPDRNSCVPCKFPDCPRIERFNHTDDYCTW